MCRPFANETELIKPTSLLDMKSLTLSDWDVRIDQKTRISFSLIGRESKTSKTIDVHEKFDNQPLNCHSLHYDNGTLVEHKTCYFDNFQPTFQTFYNHKLKKRVIVHPDDKCHCGSLLNFSQIQDIYLCQEPTCPFFICKKCAFSPNPFKRHCYKHFVIESLALKDFIFKVHKTGANVDIILPSETFHYNVNDVATTSSQRLTFFSKENNFYCDFAIMNLHLKNGKIVPFVQESDSIPSQDRFQSHRFSKLKNNLISKVLFQWNECWDVIFKDRNSQSFYNSFIDRIHDPVGDLLPDNALSQIKNPTKEYHHERIKPHVLINRMPFFYEIPILRFGDRLIINFNQHSVLNPNFKSSFIKVTQGNSCSTCDLFSGQLLSDVVCVTTNQKNQRELSINSSLLMQDMKLVGFSYPEVV